MCHLHLSPLQSREKSSEKGNHFDCISCRILHNYPGTKEYIWLIEYGEQSSAKVFKVMNPEKGGGLLWLVHHSKGDWGEPRPTRKGAGGSPPYPLTHGLTFSEYEGLRLQLKVTWPRWTAQVVHWARMETYYLTTRQCGLLSTGISHDAVFKEVKTSNEVVH